MSSVHRNALVVGSVVVLCLVGSGFSVFAADTDAESLRGIQGVMVVVETSELEMKRHGPTDDQLRSDVKLRLQIAGIKVLSQDEFSKAPGQPVLYLDLHVIKLVARRGYGCFINIGLKQNVYLERDPQIRGLTATTWSKRMAAEVHDLDHIRTKVRDLVGDFINSYISVTPKKQIDTGIRG